MKLTVGMRFVVEVAARSGYLPSRETQMITITTIGDYEVVYKYDTESGHYSRPKSTFKNDINNGVIKLAGCGLAVGDRFASSNNECCIESMLPFVYLWAKDGQRGTWDLASFMQRAADGTLRKLPKVKPKGASPVAPTPAAPAAPEPVKTSLEILQACADVQKARGAQRDAADGERSMKRTVEMFNACFGTTLTETMGWQFMVCLKMARSVHGEFTMDDYIDGTSYFALAGESAAKEA